MCLAGYTFTGGDNNEVKQKGSWSVRGCLGNLYRTSPGSDKEAVGRWKISLSKDSACSQSALGITKSLRWHQHGELRSDDKEALLLESWPLN